MIGFVCIMHQSELRPNGFRLVRKMIRSLYKSCERDFILYLFDNASNKKFEVPNYKNIRYIYIEDQMIRGLAGPYNDGIKMAISDECDLIILINDDVIISDSINKFINTILSHPHKNISVYGPLSNGLHKNSYQLANEAKKGIKEITSEKGQFKNINGFMMAFTPEFYHIVKLPNGDFCDMRKKWGGGEEVMQDRARKLGCRMFVIKECWFDHKRLSGWAKIEKWKK